MMMNRDFKPGDMVEYIYFDKPYYGVIVDNTYFDWRENEVRVIYYREELNKFSWVDSTEKCFRHVSDFPENKSFLYDFADLFKRIRVDYTYKKKNGIKVNEYNVISLRGEWINYFEYGLTEFLVKSKNPVRGHWLNKEAFIDIYMRAFCVNCYDYGYKDIDISFYEV